jgi:hypothetical protein
MGVAAKRRGDVRDRKAIPLDPPSFRRGKEKATPFGTKRVGAELEYEALVLRAGGMQVAADQTGHGVRASS